MSEFNLVKGKKALIIVAHPDDETIWMGGVMLKNADIDWTICSLCRASDTDRSPKFTKVCNFYNAKSIIKDLDDEGRLSFKKSILEIKKTIVGLNLEDYDYIFTHGKNGEYGHEKHRAVYEAITELVKEKKLKDKYIYFFNYKLKKGEDHTLTPRANSNYIIDLSHSFYKKKKDIMSSIYGFDAGGIDAGYCTNPESFLVKKY